MKIGHILRKYDPREWGGTETAILQLLDGLGRQNVESVVYAPALKGKVDDDPLAKIGVNVKTFKSFMPVLGLTEQQRRQLVAVGGNLMSFDLIPKLCSESAFSLIHLHTLGRLGGIGRFTARCCRIPYIVTIHGGVFDLPQAAKDKLLSLQQGGWEWGKVFGMLLGARKVLDDAAAILTLNPNEARRLSERYPGKRVVIMPHGIPMDAFAVDQRAAAGDAFPQIAGNRVLLIVGRIDPVKNQLSIVDLMPEILRQHPDALLVLAGAVTDEVYGEEVKRRIADLNLQPRVLLTGGLPPRDPRLVGLMQSATALIVPSISETFGLVIMEGWSASAPVISSRTSGATQIIRHGENGLLYDINDAAGFMDALRQTLQNEEAARDMAARGREVVRSEYDNLAVTARVKALYEEVIKERS